MSSLFDVKNHPIHKKDVLATIHGRIAELGTGASGALDSEPQVSTNRLYALLIGVDKYASKSIRDLSGAVADAKRVEAFLRAQIPPIGDDRLELLTNEQATASNIIHHISALSTNERICRADPILIYYAGHGSIIPKPDGWPSAEPHIQCLAPHDARVVGMNVQGVILDVTFGALLQDLADKKGKNITVILDSCHSGSGTREDYQVPRGIILKADNGGRDVTVDESYQKDVWNRDDAARGLLLLPKFANSGLQSHIVLSACGPKESAYEDSRTRGGQFTSAFLRAIESSGPNHTMTYSEIMNRFKTAPLPNQTPQCEGRDKDTRILFDKGMIQRNRPCYRVNRKGSSYTLDAGAIHGVSEDASFAVYANRDTFTSGGQSLGDLVVDKAGSLTSSLVPVDGSVLTFDEDVSEAIAVMTRGGSRKPFGVHIDSKYPKLNVIVDVLTTEVYGPTSRESSWISIALLPREEAQISLELTADKTAVVFEVLDRQIRDLGLQQLSGTVPCVESSLRSALRSAAHFFYHLRLVPKQADMGRAVSARVRVLRQTVVMESGIPMPSYEPVGDSTCVKDDNVFYPELPRKRGRRMAETLYGIDVLNKSPKGGFSLFAWMFYFDCSTLEISSFYEPPAGDVEPTLPAGMKQALPLNFGDAGVRPLTFQLSGGRACDVGFIRIFVSTRKSDLSGIPQKSAIEQVRASFQRDAGGRGKWDSQEAMWGAITIPVVQK